MEIKHQDIVSVVKIQEIRSTVASIVEITSSSLAFRHCAEE